MNTSSNRPRNLSPGLQYLLDYLKRTQSDNPGFYYAIENDNEQCGNVFWTDPTSRSNYIYFRDTVRIDTSYRTNRSKVPFVTFSGINHHAQPVLFGCALILNESENSFVWLLQTWFQAMSGPSPVSVTIEPDRLIQMAVAQVLPEARNRFCRWSIFSQTQDKLTNVYQTNPTFDFELKKCVNESDSVEEFESCWANLIGRYYLMDNEWLLSLYNIRDQWVPVFLRDVFFGELSPTVSFFFDGFFSTSTTIQMLIKQYEKAVSCMQENESKDDFETSNATPVLNTPSPMENQAANLYTKRVFLKFQGELVETLANPATIIDESGNVTIFRMKATCSCRMFDYSGIVCRHVLSVFRAKNVLMLPSEYVLRRWTRNAKTDVGESMAETGFESGSDFQESRIVRRSNLRQEAIKYVEEGAKSIQVYNVAMSALQEASRRVAAVKSKNCGPVQGTSEANEGNRESRAIENQSSSCLSREEKEKKIRELTAELDRTNQKCEVYRAILLALFRDMEDQKLKLSVKVQNARLSLKE
ncbi:protein far1-related sequence 9 [Phtheirospermum japonicum]|uniref:Protein FAR1-RELATED SEQUENCE n=1 Tax=Phtheirospermum japonicum TaxID=374723 RepID=A0A830C3X0_9LAMI|nr:protein far1-related sequence 9 [Phtheirospermum japonicum]